MSKIFLKLLDEICSLLETYKGRDKVLRTLCYTAKLLGGLHRNPDVAKKLLKFSSQMSGTRATLRLLDDLPMLQYNLQYKFGHNEPDTFMSQLGVATNVIDQIYYPIEKLSWLAEHQLVDGLNGSKWDKLSSIFWVTSIYLSLLKTIRYILVLQKHKSCNINRTELDKIIVTQKYEILTAVRLMFDFVHAVNTLPSGFLWASRLSTWQVGLIASISSVMGIYQIYYKRKI